MSKVLIVGNVLKDIYLRLDPRKESFEQDESGINWINLGFNGEGHKVFERVGVFGGAFVTLDVLKNFGIEAKIAGNSDDIEVANYRYIMCDDKDGITYFVPSNRMKTAFVKPVDDVDWIFIDRSTIMSDNLAKKIISFLENTNAKLAMYVPKLLSQPDRILAERADFIFAENDLQGLLPCGKLCFINKDSITLDGEKVLLENNKTNLMTHLTINSIAAASIFGASLAGKTVHESLLYAKANVENATLSATLNLETLTILVRDAETSNANLHLIAKSLVADRKGILAADESGGSIHKKFETMNISDDEQHRRDYRNIFLATPKLEDYVNGVILFEETAKQKADNGQNFTNFLTAKGVIPGIKVDLGLMNFPGSDEKYTKGIDGLGERLEEYYKAGLRFAKWRAAFEITDNTPSPMAIKKNCEILAEYASLCQLHKIVPIVEPEVVYDGDYSIEKSAEVTGRILDELFAELDEQGVDLKGCLLKVNMVLAGKKFAMQSTPEEVGERTAQTLREHVPKELAGVVFLSGGQTVEQATNNLRAIIKSGPFPWPVTFSFARALQDPALFTWKGNAENVAEAQKAFKDRLITNCEALIF